MLLTQTDLTNGIVGWNGTHCDRAIVLLDKGEEAERHVVWNATGTVMTQPFEQGFAMAFPEGVGENSSPYPAWLMRLDQDGSIRTRIWDIDDRGEKIHFTLAHIPGYGLYHRIVLRPENTTWDADAMLFFGDSWARFINGRIVGEQASPMTDITPTDDGFAISGYPIGTFELEGKFLEIVARGDDEEQAKRNAEGLLGLIV